MSKNLETKIMYKRKGNQIYKDGKPFLTFRSVQAAKKHVRRLKHLGAAFEAED